MASFDLTTPVGSQTDKLQITKILFEEWDDATGPLTTVTYDEFETDGTTFIRKSVKQLTDRAAIKTLLDANGTFDVYAELQSILHQQLIAEGHHGAGADV